MSSTPMHGTAGVESGVVDTDLGYTDPWDAANRLERVDEAEPDDEAPQDDEARDEPRDEAPDDDVADDETSDDDQDDDTDEAPGDEAESDAEEDENESPVAADDAVVEISGEKVPVRELKAGYLRQQDYTRKTQELAEMRQELQQNAEAFTAAIQQVEQAIASMLPPQPDPQLAQIDPAEYTRQKAAWEAEAQKLNALYQAFQQAAQPAQQALEQVDEQRINEEAEKLVTALPQLADPAKRQEFFADVDRLGRQLGFTDEELAAINDHRIYLLANLALEGLRAQQARSKVRTKKDKPRSAKRSRKAARAAVDRASQAMKRLRSGGALTLEDAAQVLDALNTGE